MTSRLDAPLGTPISCDECGEAGSVGGDWVEHEGRVLCPWCDPEPCGTCGHAAGLHGNVEPLSCDGEDQSEFCPCDGFTLVEPDPRQDDDTSG